MAALVSHLFSSSEELAHYERELDLELAEGLIRQLYRLDENVNWWGDAENGHMEELDGIAQNIIYAKIPGYDKLKISRDIYNDLWEKYGARYTIYHSFLLQVEDTLLTCCLPPH